jgi:hypothetical protein
MIKLPEYHSRYAKVMCLVLVILISGMFYIKGEEKEGSGYFESAVDTFEYIFFFEDAMRKSWDSKSALRQESYNNDFDFYLKEMTGFHREEYLFNEVMYFLLVFMVIPYFLLGCFFTSVFHPIVLDPARKVIYTVKRGKVYLFHKTSKSTSAIDYDDGHGMIFSENPDGPIAIRLKSIKEERYRIFKIGVFPHTFSMGRWNVHQILCAFGLEENEKLKKLCIVDQWMYLRWITTFSLYPSFLCKKVDDPYYLAQIDEYLAQQEKSSD